MSSTLKDSFCGIENCLEKVLSILLNDINSRINDLECFLCENNMVGDIKKEFFDIASDIGEDISSFYEEKDFVKSILKQNQVLKIFLFRTAYFKLMQFVFTYAFNSHLSSQKIDNHMDFIGSEFNEIVNSLCIKDKNALSFLISNNYSWYEPEQNIIEKIFLILAKFGKVNIKSDLLGRLFEASLDKIDKKRRGKFYTCNSIINLIWDLVGYNNKQNIWSNENKKLKKIFEPAMGTGSFIIEAFRRINHNCSDLDRTKLLLEIPQSIFGYEISKFEYTIALVNYLIQFIQLIKVNLIIEQKINLFNDNALSRFNKDNSEKDKYDYCCGNPPYIGEDENKELFRKLVNEHPEWKKYYQGKMDYFYFFIIQGLHKLKEGGKLCFITTSYWLTADGAKKLRKYIIDNSIIEVIIDFGELKVFSNAKGQHNIVFMLRKEKDATIRANNKIKIVKINDNSTKEYSEDYLNDLCSNIIENINEKEISNSMFTIRSSPVRQGELSETAWYFDFDEITYNTLSILSKNGVPLSTICEVNQGFVSGCHKINKNNVKKISNEKIEKNNINVGDGVFVLSKDEYEKIGFNNSKIIKKVIKSSSISKYVIDNSNYEYLIYTNKFTKIDEFPVIKSHLLKFKEILKDKRETREGKLPWFSLHWAREAKIFEEPKIVVPYRSKNNGFAYDEHSFYGSTDMYFVSVKSGLKYDLKYILAILNSSVIDFWCRYKIKRKGKLREFFATPLKNIPIPEIDFNYEQHVICYEKLILLVDEIILKIKENQNNEVCDIQKEIDLLVYKLYRLNSNEIEIIEESLF